MWEHMKELAQEQSDETCGRKLSQDSSSEEKIEDALPRVHARFTLYIFTFLYYTVFHKGTPFCFLIIHSNDDQFTQNLQQL